jgi:tRNA-binding EMAP/Myf-like protein
VSSLYKSPAPTRGVVVGLVARIRPHPNGDRIWLADVDIGLGEKLQIVFGGEPNVKPGDLVPVAPCGSRVRGQKIRRRRYRGEVSNGMLCSLAELAWDRRAVDRVAVLRRSNGLRPGMLLDNRSEDWETLVADPPGNLPLSTPPSHPCQPDNLARPIA